MTVPGMNPLSSLATGRLEMELLFLHSQHFELWEGSEACRQTREFLSVQPCHLKSILNSFLRLSVLRPQSLRLKPILGSSPACLCSLCLPHVTVPTAWTSGTRTRTPPCGQTGRTACAQGRGRLWVQLWGPRHLTDFGTSQADVSPTA